MNAPLLWIFIPGMASLGLFLLRRKEKLTTLLGIVTCLLLALLAWTLPIGRPVSIGPWSFLPVINITDSLVILGRSLVLENADRALLIMVYLGLAFWFGGGYIARAGIIFVPLGLAMGVLLTAALAVEPFLYAALLIELTVLVSIPLLSPPGHKVGPGVLRYLTFQTLGMPSILFTGWLLTGIGSQPSDPGFILRIVSLLGLGFALFMAIFPFHIWIPMIIEEIHPYRAVFVIFVIPTVVSMFGLSFLDQYAWLRSIGGLITGFRLVGIIMVVGSGIWAAFQNHLGRILGFTATAEIGLTLLTISLSGTAENPPAIISGQSGVSILAQGFIFAQLLPRGIALALWALALSAFNKKSDELAFPEVTGIGRSFPIAATSLLLAQFSLAGFPLLASFPLLSQLWLTISNLSLLLGIMLLIGSIGLVVAGFRILIVLFKTGETIEWHVSETRSQRWLFTLGGVMLLLVGLLPQWFYPVLIDFANLISASAP